MRLAKLDVSVLDHPEQELAIPPPNELPYDATDMMAPRPLKLLKVREILGLLKKAAKTVLADGSILSDVDVSVFFDGYKKKFDKKQRAGTSRSI